MFFGDETPFYLRPLPNRGQRRLEVEARQHGPGYRHPLDFSDYPPQRHAAVGTAAANANGSPVTTTSSSSTPSVSTPYIPRDPPVPLRDFNPVYNIIEHERVHPRLSPTKKLQADRLAEQEKEEKRLEMRRQRAAARTAALEARQREEIARSELRAANMAGSTMMNVESEGRDTITHACFTRQAQEEREYRDARDRHRYHSRQRLISQRLHKSGFDVITGQPREDIYVPPMPEMPSSLRGGGQDGGDLAYLDA